MSTLAEYQEMVRSGRINPIVAVAELRQVAASIENYEKGLEMLEVSTAKAHCLTICETKRWDTQEFPMFDKGADRGAFLVAKSPGSGSVDNYYGQMFLVGADALSGTIVVYSQAFPFTTRVGPRGGWDRNGIHQAITTAFNNPGSYEWCEGMASEQLRYRSLKPL